MRATPARLAILDTLCHSTAALDAQQVQSVLASAAASASLKGLKTDRVTIYRTLNSLVRAGIAHRVNAGDRVFRYAMAGGHDAHTLAGVAHHAHHASRADPRSQRPRGTKASRNKVGKRTTASTPDGESAGTASSASRAHDTHPHFVCDHCGRIECLNDLELVLRNVHSGRRPSGRSTRAGQHASASDIGGRKIIRRQVMLYGLCVQCGRA